MNVRDALRRARTPVVVDQFTRVSRSTMDTLIVVGMNWQLNVDLMVDLMVDLRPIPLGIIGLADPGRVAPRR